MAERITEQQAQEDPTAALLTLIEGARHRQRLSAILTAIGILIVAVLLIVGLALAYSIDASQQAQLRHGCLRGSERTALIVNLARRQGGGEPDIAELDETIDPIALHLLIDSRDRELVRIDAFSCSIEFPPPAL